MGVEIAWIFIFDSYAVLLCIPPSMHLCPCDLALAETYDYLSCLKLSTSNFLSVIFISKGFEAKLEKFYSSVILCKVSSGVGAESSEAGLRN